MVVCTSMYIYVCAFNTASLYPACIFKKLLTVLASERRNNRLEVGEKIMDCVRNITKERWRQICNSTIERSVVYTCVYTYAYIYIYISIHAYIYTHNHTMKNWESYAERVNYVSSENLFSSNALETYWKTLWKTKNNLLIKKEGRWLKIMFYEDLFLSLSQL